MSAEPDWKPIVDDIARRFGFPTDEARVAEAIASLSAVYNTSNRGPVVPSKDDQAARLYALLWRDAAKAAGAMRELAPWAATLPRVRVLDLGAGLGATALGVVRAVRSAGSVAPIEILAVDRDKEALDVGAELGRHLVGVTWSTRAADARAVTEPADLVAIGQTLCELDRALDDDARVEVHATRLASLLGVARAVLVVEPASRDASRHLQRVRDRVVALGWPPLGPCVHDRPCPMLARERDWCHERRNDELPDFASARLRAAGLRGEAPTFSYLALRADRTRGAGVARVVSDVLVSKGRADVYVCGRIVGEDVGWHRVGRLDRHASEANAGFDDLRRGDSVVDPLPARLGVDTVVRRVPPA